MANRRFEMYQYREVLVRMRLGVSDRAIKRSGLMGRVKAKQVREIAEAEGWLTAPWCPFVRGKRKRQRFSRLWHDERSLPKGWLEPFPERGDSLHGEGVTKPPVAANPAVSA